MCTSVIFHCLGRFSGSSELGLLNHFAAGELMSLLPLYKCTIKIASNKIFLLRKIRKYIDYNTAISIYKQTILPMFDYSGFFANVVN